MGWLDRAPVWLHPDSSEPLTAEQSIEITSQAAQILAAHPKVRVAIPLQDQQLPTDLDPQVRSRLLTAGAALVSPAQNPPAGPEARLRWHWLQTDLPGLIPYAGAGGDERDVRVWAWLAFLRHADLIVWDHTLPTVDSPDEPADPNSLTWFYPGRWFGVEGLVPTIQLEWLRRAQQDYEYLWLADQRGEVINALQMARLITKPVEIVSGQSPDPVYALMTGTTSQSAWDRAQELLAQTILLRQPGTPFDQSRQRALYIQTLQWAQPQERPQLLARAAQWTLTGPRKEPSGRTSGNWLGLNLAIDIYNASDATPDRNGLQWNPPPARSGWEVRPQPLEVPRLATYRVQRQTMSASFNLNRINSDAGKPTELSFINGYTKALYPMQVRLPIAASERREGPIQLDGKLNDWSDADAIQDGPLVLMTSRPDLQKQELRFAPGSQKIYSTWGQQSFYLAFSLDGLSPEEHHAHNDVDYQSRRAWGEDLCEMLIQPLYADNTTGPVLHVVCKPNGADWVDRKQDPKDSNNDWRTAEASGIRYATTVSNGRWRGELGIPWKLINLPTKEMPVLLRFNFVQHRHETCQSASWCGPIDYGRDEDLMGVLYLKSASE
jgi:hypothetical protein